MRSKLEDRYAYYVQADEKEKLLAGLQEAEDWLYTEEGEDATKSTYTAKLNKLLEIGGPIAARYKESESRPKAAAALREVTNDFITKAQSGDAKYAHIDAKDLESVVEKAATHASWLDNQMAKQAERPKNVNPAMTSEEILKRRDETQFFCAAILNRPAPKVKTTEPEAPKAPEPEPTVEENEEIDLD